GAGKNCVADGFTDLGAVLRRIEETKMAVPGNVDEDLEILCRGEIEKPFCGNLVNADYISAEFANFCEVTRGLLGRREQLSGCIRCEGTIGNALGVKFPFAQPEKFAIHGHPRSGESLLRH